jgi:uncharacterized membrane protein
MTRVNVTNQVVTGAPLPGLIFLVFLVLKLTGYIDWSWWWVTAPLWLIFAVFFIGFGIYLLVLTIISACGRRRRG